ncbi:MAG: apolipoprotein N-acyltransferase [Alphaproteobacteria bacterium]|nr:apolipoprotein N-acyltransferase [Alphaproteobacteria bacterium]
MSTLGFAPHYFVGAALLSWLGLVLALHDASTPQKAFYRGYAYGAGYFVFGLSWITNALTVDAYTATHFAWLIPFVYLGCAFFMGLFFAIPSYLHKHYPLYQKHLWSFVAYFFLFEWLRGWILTGFPWNLLGAIWVDTPAVLQSVSLFGVLGLSLMTYLLIAGLYALLFTKKYRFISGLILLAWCGLFLYGTQRLKIPTPMTAVRLKLIQPGLPQGLKWSRAQLEENFYLHLDLSKQGKPADLIVWPESAVAFDIAHNDYYRAQIQAILEPTQRLLTGFIYRGENVHNSLGVFSKDGLEQVYHKHHLVPFGEYIPLADILPLETIARGVGGLTPGESDRILSPFPYPPLAPAICYESIFSGAIVQSDIRPDWILIVTNDAWFGLSRGPYQHLAEAQLRAVEEGLPVVRVAYNGITAVINPLGQILISAPLQTRVVIDTFLPAPFARTLFSLL